MNHSTRVYESFDFCGLVLSQSKFQFLRAKTVLNPETPGMSPDTPDLEHSGESSGYRPGNSGLGSPETPGINPDTPEIPDSPD